MRYIDISWPLNPGMTTYKNRDDFSVVKTKEWHVHHMRESRMNCGAHVGTHIDAPAHFIESGGFIESVALENLIGPCLVVDLSDVKGSIQQSDLEKITMTASRVLFKTKNSERAFDDPFDPNFIFLSETAARYLVQKGIVCIGIDYLGIERNQPGHPTHKILLGAGIAIIEGLRLGNVLEGEYQLLCLPLALRGLDAAPARAVLREL